MNNLVTPFLKWIGGKQRMISILQDYLPADIAKEGKITTYIEPFLGAGSLFFHIRQHYPNLNCVISDKNEKLMNVYKVLRENVNDLIEILYNLQELYNKASLDERKKYYYEVRNDFNNMEYSISKSQVDNLIQAARFIFLNKTSFNGIYRENKLGEFNTPIGDFKKQKHILFSDRDLLMASKLLQDVEILHGDYTVVDDYINDKTFIYLDPPYRPILQKSNFKEYTKHGQADSFQVGLAKYVKNLDSLGVYVMTSNSDPTEKDPDDNFFQRHYGFCEINEVKATRTVSADKSKRGKISELIITNYNDYLKNYKHKNDK